MHPVTANYVCLNGVNEYLHCLLPYIDMSGPLYWKLEFGVFRLFHLKKKFRLNIKV